MKVKIVRERVPNCTGPAADWGSAAYQYGLMGQLGLAASAIPFNVFILLLLCCASRLSRSLRWVLANGCIAGLCVATHFIFRASLRLSALGEPGWCSEIEKPSVTPSSCMLEEAPWTAAETYLFFFPLGLCADRLLCSTLRLKRAKALGQYAAIGQWIMGWGWAIILVLESRSGPDLFFCHNLFPHSPFLRSAALWIPVLLSFLVLGSVAFIHRSNTGLIYRALNRAIFYPRERRRIMDTVELNRALFPVLLFHVLIFTPLALVFFALPPELKTYRHIACLSLAHSGLLFYILLYPILLLGIGELRQSCRELHGRLRSCGEEGPSQKETLHLLAGEYESAMAALLHSTMLAGPGGSMMPFHLGPPIMPHHHHNGFVDEPHEPEDEDELVHV